MDRAMVWMLLALAAGCGPRNIEATDCGGVCQVAGPDYPGVGECVDATCTPTYGECIARDQFETCAEACAAQGSACSTNGCGGHTYLVYTIPEYCEDPEIMGVEVEHDCGEPIGWQVNTAARCCCEQDDP